MREPVRRENLRTTWFQVAGACVGALLGSLLAVVVGAPRADDLDCSAPSPGVAVAACLSGPLTARWITEWALGGAVLGLLVAIVVSAMFGVTVPHRRPQRHLTRQ